MHKGGKITGVYRDSEFADFYIVDVHDANGRDIRYNTNGSVIYSREVSLNSSQLPEPVKKAIHQLIKGDRIRHLWWRQYEFYQFEQPVDGLRPLIVRVAANGDVLHITETPWHPSKPATAAPSTHAPTPIPGAAAPGTAAPAAH
jgi:hypothetical protein